MVLKSSLSASLTLRVSARSSHTCMTAAHVQTSDFFLDPSMASRASKASSLSHQFSMHWSTLKSWSEMDVIEAPGPMFALSTSDSSCSPQQGSSWTP
eukprot:scaffold301_cov243-Pinguiococcus_pyrenoidosus.AAC.61